MKKLLVMVSMLLLSMVLLEGCGSSGIGGIGGNIIKDEGALVKIMDQFKNLDGLKGQEIQVFQDVNVYTGEAGNRVIINVLKPGTDDEVDNYEYRGSWGKANPVQLSGKGKAVDNCISLNKLDFAKVPQMYKAMEAKLKDIEGAKINDYFSFRYWRGNWYAAIGAKSPRAQYSAEFDLDGNMTKFQKN